jgi:hypothetical protein
MADKLKTFDWSQPSNITPEGTDKVVYPWEDWLDGDIWQLTEGDDFDTHPLMMERIIRTRATARGAKVRLRHQPKTPYNGKRGKVNPFGLIIVQRTDVVGPAESAKASNAAEAAKQERARVRAEKKAAAEKAALETLSNAGIKPAKKAVAKNGAAPVKSVAKTVAKRPAAPVKHAVSKRPAHKVKAGV